MMTCLERSEYDEILTVENLNKILEVEVITSAENWSTSVQHAVEGYIKNKVPEQTVADRQQEMLTIAVASLQLFAQNNWVGPPNIDVKDTYLLPVKFHSEEKIKAWKDHIQQLLSIDGEPIYSVAENLAYLALSKLILQDCRHCLNYCQTAEIWLLRCLRIQQELLEERSPTIKKYIVEIIEQFSKKEPIMTDDKYRDLQIQFHLEAGYMMYFYYESTHAATHFNTACKLTGLQVELTGALGKRTRFQQNELSQLLLTVKRSPEEDYCLPEDTQQIQLEAENKLPVNVPLDDDTVLEEIKLAKDVEDSKTPVSAIEQAVILGLLYHHRKSNANVGDILKEESLAYIDFVLHQPQNWCVQSTALLHRAMWEGESVRRMQRCMTQLEELVNQYKRPEPSAPHRMSLLHCVQLPPKWTVERHLGNFFMKIGATSAALEVFLRIQIWEEVIKCYASMGRTEKAEKVIREQLAIKETPTLYCYLGDVTNEPEHYVKAWEISNGRFSRAKRNLGYYYLRRSEFEESLPHFQKSLDVNGLQIGVWFSYGCALMACQKFEEGARAFHRCVTLESNNFEAWSNMSTCYVNSKQKPRAFTALQEALKCEYENWRVWENYLLIGTDIGEFSEVIRAYHRMLELKDKYTDNEVLTILVKAVNEDLLDAKERPTAPLRPKLQELFGRVTSKVTSDATVWRLYGELLLGSTEISQQDRERALQYLQKSHRCNIQVPNWEKNVEQCKKVGKQSTELAGTYLQCCSNVTENTQAIQLLSSSKLMVKGVLTKIKQTYTDPMTKEISDDFRGICNDLEEKLKTVENELITRKGQT